MDEGVHHLAFARVQWEVDRHNRVQVADQAVAPSVAVVLVPVLWIALALHQDAAEASGPRLAGLPEEDLWLNLGYQWSFVLALVHSSRQL